MSGIEPFHVLLGLNLASFPKEKQSILEADLFFRLYFKLKNHFNCIYKADLELLKLTVGVEGELMDNNFLRFIINDLVSSEEYTISGIAYHTNTPEDVIYEYAMGYCMSPSAKLVQRLIGLHRVVRKELYSKIVQEISEEYFSSRLE